MKLGCTTMTRYLESRFLMSNIMMVVLFAVLGVLFLLALVAAWY